MNRHLLILALLAVPILCSAAEQPELVELVQQEFSPDTDVVVTHSNYSEGLTIGRQRLAAASYRGRVYFGGGSPGGDIVDIFDVETKEWTSAKLLAPRMSLTATAAGGKILFAGGKPAYSGVDIYDTETGTVSGARLSAGRQLLAATTVLDRWAIFAGGEGIRKQSKKRRSRRSRHHRGLLADARDMVLDEDEVDWFDDMNGLDDDDLCGFYDDCEDDEFEAVGDCVAGPDGTVNDLSLCRKSPEPGKQVDIYDALTGTWISGPWLSESRRKLAAASSGEIAAIGGGWTLKHRLSSTVDIWNSTSGLWSRAKLSAPRMYLAAASAGSQILFGGGFHMVPKGKRMKGTGSNVVDLFDTATGKWTVANLNFGQYNLAGASVAGRWAVFAGASMPKFPVINMYDSVTGNWTMLDPMSVASSCLAGAGVELSSSRREGDGPGTDGCAVFGGGEAKPGGITPAVDVYCFSASAGNDDQAASVM